MFEKNQHNDSLARRLLVNSLEECLYFPQYFEVETIRACNARCIMCTIKDWDHNNHSNMTVELFEKFVEEVRKYNGWIKSISLSRDGEPTLDKYLPSRVAMLKEAGILEVTFVTNSQLLTEELGVNLLKNGLDDIMISMDSIKKETFEKIRIGLNYDTVINNILKFIEIRDKINPSMKIRIRMVVVEENRNEVNDWLTFWTGKIGRQDKAYVMPKHSWGNQLYKEHEDAVEFYAHKPCVSPFSSMSIHVDGKVGLCATDYNLKYLMGDFTEQTIEEIWRNKGFMNVRLLHAGKKRNEIQLCRGCHIWDKDYGRKEQGL